VLIASNDDVKGFDCSNFSNTFLQESEIGWQETEPRLSFRWAGQSGWKKKRLSTEGSCYGKRIEEERVR